MTSTWSIRETIFTPSEIKSFFGISPGTQAQWRARGFLNALEHTRGEVSISDTAAHIFLRDCSDRKVGLDVASKAVAAVAASARRYVVTSLVPLPFHGSNDEHREYREWQARNHLVEANLIDRALGDDAAAGARYVAIEAKQPCPIKQLDDLEDDPCKSPINRLVTDCWAIGEAIKLISDRDLIWVSK